MIRYLILCLLLVPSLVFAQVSGQEAEGSKRWGPPAFEDLDQNGDGELTQAEMLTHAAKRIESRFQRIDEDGDGTISEGEFANRRKGKGFRRGMRRGWGDPDNS